MALLTKPAFVANWTPSFAPSTAIIYVTAGALLDVWTVVYYLAFVGTGPMDNSQFFWVTGFFFTGATLMVIGFALGPIGRSARQAEVPPAVAVPDVPAVVAPAKAVVPTVQSAQPVVAPQVRKL